MDESDFIYLPDVLVSANTCKPIFEGTLMAMPTFWCPLCKANFKRPIHAIQHLRGKEHQVRYDRAQWLQSSSGKSESEPVAQENMKRKLEFGDNGYENIPLKKIKVDNVNAVQKQDVNTVQKQAVVKPPASQKNSFADYATDVKQCRLCDIRFTSDVHADTHYKGKRHAQAVIDVSGPAGGDIPPNNPIPEKITEIKKEQPKTSSPSPPSKDKSKGVAENERCEFCSIDFSSDVHALQHYQGKRHAEAIALDFKEKRGGKTDFDRKPSISNNGLGRGQGGGNRERGFGLTRGTGQSDMRGAGRGQGDASRSTSRGNMRGAGHGDRGGRGRGDANRGTGRGNMRGTGHGDRGRGRGDASRSTGRGAVHGDTRGGRGDDGRGTGQGNMRETSYGDKRGRGRGTDRGGRIGTEFSDARGGNGATQNYNITTTGSGDSRRDRERGFGQGSIADNRQGFGNNYTLGQSVDHGRDAVPAYSSSPSTSEGYYSRQYKETSSNYGNHSYSNNVISHSNIGYTSLNAISNEINDLKRKLNAMY